MELGKPGYIKQSVAYFNNHDYASAYALGREFAAKFPDEMIAHFLLAKAAFWTGNYQESALAARKAFNMAKTPGDMLPCAILASTAYHEMGEYAKGYEILKAMERVQSSEELEQMLFIFSLAVKDEKEAMKHMDELRRLNKKAADDFMERVISRL